MNFDSGKILLQFETQYLDIPSGERLAYRECGAIGDLSKPVMMFLHGFSMSSMLCEDQMAMFGDDYHCLAVDVPARRWRRGQRPPALFTPRPSQLIKQPRSRSSRRARRATRPPSLIYRDIWHYCGCARRRRRTRDRATHRS